jgi:hypothetical protein
MNLKPGACHQGGKLLTDALFLCLLPFLRLRNDGFGFFPSASTTSQVQSPRAFTVFGCLLAFFPFSFRLRAAFLLNCDQQFKFGLLRGPL